MRATAPSPFHLHDRIVRLDLPKAAPTNDRGRPQLPQGARAADYTGFFLFEKLIEFRDKRWGENRDLGLGVVARTRSSRDLGLVDCDPE